MWGQYIAGFARRQGLDYTYAIEYGAAAHVSGNHIYEEERKNMQDPKQPVRVMEGIHEQKDSEAMAVLAGQIADGLKGN